MSEKAELKTTVTMEPFQVIEMRPSPEDYNRLRQAVGWGIYDLAVIAHSLSRTLFCVCAIIEGQIVGMARVIGDEGMVFYIQDVIVLPEFQKRGIGTRMMDCVMAYLHQKATHNTIIGLMSAAGKETFYERYGFTRRPTERLGCGMTLFKP